MLKHATIISIIVSSVIVLVLSQNLDYRTYYTQSPTCRLGRIQSPIDLMDKQSQFFPRSNQTAQIVYETYSPIQSASLKFNGRVLNVAPDATADNFGFVGFERGGSIKQYKLVNIEFNYPAEHQIEGQQPDLEVKLIHQKIIGYETTVNQYRKIPDANTHLIIVLLFSLNSKYSDNNFMTQLVSTLPTTTNTNGASVNLDITAFNLVRDKQFYFYEGSMTSDPCDEVVNYVVVKEMYAITPNNLNAIATQYTSRYLNGVANKPIAEYYGRSVYRNYMNATEASAGYLKHFLSFSLLILCALLF
jgi:carbonic anhydrase